jgi:hypothetical protein
MRLNIRKVTNLDLIGHISDDVNKDQYVLLNVEPVEHVNPVDKNEEEILKVAVHNGLAYSVPPGVAKSLIALGAGMVVEDNKEGGHEDTTAGSGDLAA